VREVKTVERRSIGEKSSTGGRLTENALPARLFISFRDHCLRAK